MLLGRPVSGMPADTIRYIICKHMHWDYWVFDAQPVEFISSIVEHINVEAEVAKREGKTTNTEAGR